MQLDKALLLIKTVAQENNYQFEKGEGNFWELYINRNHGVSYGLTCSSSDYIEVCHWEGEQYGDGEYGRAIYSLRCMSDVVRFCNMIICGEELRAKR
ncbi:hypothetical protein [Vibrio scophthalmi]|uniref:Uncharacterized protein n=1 Tax=Vibrio scophthalmi TaxID=45658 RepID=A0A1E3WFY5_9VIBR|nr:hypothetical protein [Vibrio scophthalmi]ODS04727.1 hypothetical protein VSF3289_03866 [Vibrio scophthalmi]ODS04735.1 hypothetical protein VSF3289_03874 [Vibrio scophthalmi]